MQEPFGENHMERLTEELRANGFDKTEAGEVAISVRQLVLIVWRKQDRMEEVMVTKKDLAYGGGAIMGVLATIEVLTHLIQ